MCVCVCVCVRASLRRVSAQEREKEILKREIEERERQGGRGVEDRRDLEEEEILREES